MLCPSVTPLFSHPFLWIFVLNDVCPTPSHCFPAPLGCATEDGQPQPCLRPSQPGPLDTFRTAGPGCAARATAPLLCRCVSQLCLCEDAGKESGRGRALAALPGAHRVAAGGRRPIPHRRCAGKARGPVQPGLAQMSPDHPAPNAMSQPPRPCLRPVSRHLSLPHRDARQVGLGPQQPMLASLPWPLVPLGHWVRPSPGGQDGCPAGHWA